MCIFKKNNKNNPYIQLEEEFGLEPFTVHLIVSNYYALFESFLKRKPFHNSDYIADNVHKMIVDELNKRNKFAPVHSVVDGKDKRLCGKCKKGLRPNDSFCPYCGAEVIKDEAK